ncbi:MAG: T9SS type A sorting domain-containing protein [Flavobacterium sp. JAD_PAG50586_2]|nr:MAG: T9SS type A sorting domain-containing protein [Flavobacterium sp. JAD_PAG50586_2]
MKKLLKFLVLILTGFCGNAQIVTIPDANFKAKLLAADTTNTIAYNGLVAIKIDSNNNNEIEVSEALQVTGLNVTIADIYDLTGIGSFTTLRSLNCTQNHITAIDLSTLTNLKSLYCSLNLLTSLDLTGLTSLVNLECAENVLTQINFANLTSLQTVNCRFNFLTSLQLNVQTNLQSLNCDYNQLTILDVSNLTQLTYLACQSNQFLNLNLSNLLNINFLNCSFNQLSTLDLSGLNDLTTLNCSHNQITALDITDLSQLNFLNCESNLIGNAFLFSDMPDLHAVYCHENLIPSFGFSNVENLQILDCSLNQISDLDVSSLPQLSVLNCNDNTQLVNLNIKNGNNEQFLNFSGNPNLIYVCADEGQLTDIENLITQYGYTNCDVNSLCDLATNIFDLGEAFKVFPSPAKNYLQLQIQVSITIQSITIYDIIGQAVIIISTTKNVSPIDVSGLKTGIYFIELTSDKGTTIKKFLKA